MYCVNNVSNVCNVNNVHDVNNACNVCNVCNVRNVFNVCNVNTVCNVWNVCNVRRPLPTPWQGRRLGPPEALGSLKLSRLPCRLPALKTAPRLRGSGAIATAIYMNGLTPWCRRPLIGGLVTEGSVEILKARKELAWLALPNLRGFDSSAGKRHS